MEMKELILREIEKVPERYHIEILDFIRFLEAKELELRMETAIASESSPISHLKYSKVNEVIQRIVDILQQ